MHGMDQEKKAMGTQSEREHDREDEKSLHSIL